ncbi:MAG: hypothetical protein RIR12_1849 [Bacteroidota bacterium]|jgi:uncharacterized protein YndB with AHSA1/START domain
MERAQNNLMVEVLINAPIEKVWDCWTSPAHITQWNYAADDWHCPQAANDLRVGGKQTATMAARDGSFSFDFWVVHDEIMLHQRIASTMGDGRRMRVVFSTDGNATRLTEFFQPEKENPLDLQQQGWQAILDNFKKHVEADWKNKLQFTVQINAPVEKVYQLMLADKTYREWTAIFNPTSSFEGKWETGAKMLFVGIAENGQKGGMVSRIREAKENEYVCIEHVGILEGDVEIIEGPKVQDWAGALEIYRFHQTEAGTYLVIEMDATAEFKSYFETTYPKALQKLKEICEL